MWNFPLFPEQASTIARRVDALYFFELGFVVFFTALICVLILTFAVRYRRGLEGRPLAARRSRATRARGRSGSASRCSCRW